MLRLFLLGFLISLSLPSFAGKISGAVKDGKDGTGLEGVIVNIVGFDKGASTDSAGNFEINDVADGTYEVQVKYVSYKKESQKVTVTGDQPVVLNFSLKAEGTQLTGISVKSARATGTEMAVLSEIRKSNMVVSGVSANQIAKTMDRNAADVVKRIPGVTIQDDRFINVRGLADRYNTVWLNDAGAPSAETDKKSFSFDLIPSGLIDRILVFKTPSPELPGDFAGGMVKIYTTSLPAKNSYSFGISSSYRSGSTGTDFNYNERSSTDWLGYDNGMRGIPAGSPDRFDASASGNESNSKLFKNDWVVFNKKQPVDLRLNGSASNIFNIGKVKIGNTFGFSYSNTSTNYKRDFYDYSGSTTELDLHYLDKESSNKVNIGLLDNLVMAVGNTKIEFKNLYNQVGTSSLVYRTNVPDSIRQPNANNELAYAMGYESRATYAAQLTGSHHNDLNSRKYNWAFGYTDMFRNQPSLRRIEYTEGALGYNTSIQAKANITNGGRFYSELYENIYSFSHHFSQRFMVTDKFNFEVNAGNFIEYKSRNFNARELGYTLQRAGTIADSLQRLPVNQIFAEQNIGDMFHFRIDESTPDYDHYSATNRLIASFISLNVPVTDRLKVIGGVRYEDNLYTLNASKNQRPVAPVVQTKFLLPSVNLSYNFSSKSLLRAAYGKTVNRPEFRETAPFFFYDFQRRMGTYGAEYLDLTLDVAQIQNFDLRYEFYPSAGEMFQAGLFYKSFDKPIQQVLDYISGGPGLTFINARNAKSYGVEFDVRKNLMFVDDKLGTNFLKNFTIVGNLTLSKSEQNVDSTKEFPNFIKKSTMQGQSNYVVNFGAYYQNDTLGLQASLLYNVYGPRLYALGTTTDDPSIGELAFHSLDFTISKTFFKHYNLNFGVQNLLDQSIRFYNDRNFDTKFDTKEDTPFTTYKPGRYFTVGLKVRF